MENYKFPGIIKVVSVEDLPDGSAKIVFDADEEFKEGYKKNYNLEEWSQEHFDKFLQDAIDNMAKKIKEEDNEKIKKE